MSETQNDQVVYFVTKFFKDFSEPLDDDAARKSIAAVCSPQICWTDHAFHIQRNGLEAVVGLRTAFNHCNQPLETRIKKLHRISSGVVVEAIWVGCCKNDIVRPDGQLAVKANGRDFVCHVCFVMEVNSVDGISKIDEYYNKPWWDSIGEGGYHKVQGASMKSQS